MLCDAKPRKAPLVNARNTWTKIRLSLKSRSIRLCQNMVVHQKATWRKAFQTSFTSHKLPIDGRLLLHLPDAACVGRALHTMQPLAPRGSKRTCSLFCCSCALTWHSHLCLVFGRKFNTKSALFVNQLPTFVAKNRFSRRFVLMRKGVGCTCSQNVFLFKEIAICARIWAICC